MAKALSHTERTLLAEVQIEQMWPHLEHLCAIDRTSGSPGEYEAAEYLAAQLRAYGCEVRMHEFDAYLSYPRSARLLVPGPDGGQIEMPAKTRSFSESTGPAGVSGEILYVPGSSDMFTDTDTAGRLAGLDLAGKIVLSEGGGRQNMLMARHRGALAYIHLWPSDEDVIHEGIVTPVWGTPGPDDLANLPQIPVIAVRHRDGVALREAAATSPQGLIVTIHCQVETGWHRLLLPEAVIRGRTDDFVLVGGHLDSWHLGATDNATGNVCCLELARILQARRGSLLRGVRIAWWPGHSTGRYAGSAWYCDHHWQELYDHCVSYINIDSPGPLGADDYSTVTAVAENADFARAVVAAVTGQTPEIERPVRAGDQSFWGPGVSSLFMLLSNRPPGLRAAVGGSGMGWWWHTEQDTIDKVDGTVLHRDTQVHLLATWRLCTDQRLPLQLAPLAAELAERIAVLAAQTAPPQLDWSALRAAAAQLLDAAAGFDASWPAGPPAHVASYNRQALAAIRWLTPVSFSAVAPHLHGPATPTSILPLLDPAMTIGQFPADSDEQRFWLAELKRRQNAVQLALVEAARRLRPSG